MLTEVEGVVDGLARDGEEKDAVDGVIPRYVAAPATIEQAAELLTMAQINRWMVTPRGAGTKMRWGNPPRRVDLLLDMHRMNAVIAHEAGDLVVIAQAGTPLDVVQRTVGAAGQMLAIDSLWPGATLGGIVAANASGPRRVRYGTMKDLLIGITVVLPGGIIARSGGKVVKNVAGYDLGKLFTGSLGTLGLIVETIFRLHARPAGRRALAVSLSSPARLGEALQTLLNSPLTPVAIDLRWERGRGHLIPVFEGIEPSVEAQAQRAGELLQPFGDVAAWPDVAELQRTPWEEGKVGVKVTTVLTELPAVLSAIEEIAAERGVRARTSGHAGAGVILLALDGTVEDVATAVTDLRRRLVQGHAVIVEAPRSIKATVDVWGQTGDAVPLMRRVKAQFDPENIMSPGRFVGGI